MNYLIILLIGILTITIIIPSAFAQVPLDSDRDVYIFVQTFVRDSDGNLVYYFENDKFTHKNFKELNEFLDFEATRGNDPIYDVNGQKFQIIQRSKTTENNPFQLVSSTLLSDSQQPRVDFLVRYAHDAYFLTPDDVVTQVWTFLRTIN